MSLKPESRRRLRTLLRMERIAFGLGASEAPVGIVRDFGRWRFCCLLCGGELPPGAEAGPVTHAADCPWVLAQRECWPEEVRGE